MVIFCHRHQASTCPRHRYLSIMTSVDLMIAVTAFSGFQVEFFCRDPTDERHNLDVTYPDRLTRIWKNSGPRRVPPSESFLVAIPYLVRHGLYLLYGGLDHACQERGSPDGHFLSGLFPAELPPGFVELRLEEIVEVSCVVYAARMRLRNARFLARDCDHCPVRGGRQGVRWGMNGVSFPR